jgi:hypothetical protein
MVIFYHVKEFLMSFVDDILNDGDLKDVARQFSEIQKILGVRVEVHLDGRVSVLRLSWVDGKIFKEALLDSGDWMAIAEGAVYPVLGRVYYVAPFGELFDPTDWQFPK